MQANQHISDIQTALGFTGKDVDGKRGPKTDAAILAAADEGRLTVAPPLVVITAPGADSDIPATGVEKLKGVHNVLTGIIHEAAIRCDIPFTVIEGLRTAARQAQLVKSGASKTSNSRHLTGHAVDVAAWIDGKISWNWPHYEVIARAIKQAGAELGVPVEWGGDWKSFKDGPHFQLPRSTYPETGGSHA